MNSTSIVIVVKLAKSQAAKRWLAIVFISIVARLAWIDIVDPNGQVGAGNQSDIGAIVFIRPVNAWAADEESENIIEITANVFRIFFRTKGITKAQGV